MGEISITGYRPGAIGRVTELQATYYARTWGLNRHFEAELAAQMGEFHQRFNPAHDGFWLAIRDGEVVGSMTADCGYPSEDGPRLRWLVLAPGYQGMGLGRKLFCLGVDFCRDLGIPSVHLWTFGGLDPARRLYESCGFRLEREVEDEAWGRPIVHQMFRLDYAAEGKSAQTRA